MGVRKATKNNFWPSWIHNRPKKNSVFSIFEQALCLESSPHIFLFVFWKVWKESQNRFQISNFFWLLFAKGKNKASLVTSTKAFFVCFYFLACQLLTSSVQKKRKQKLIFKDRAKKKRAGQLYSPFETSPIIRLKVLHISSQTGHSNKVIWKKKRRPPFAIFFFFFFFFFIQPLEILEELVEKNFQNRMGFKGPSKAD